MTEKDPAPIKVAFILDNTVIDVMNTDDRWGAIFLSDPTMVDVSDLVKEGKPLIGGSYNPLTKQVIPVEITEAPAAPVVIPAE
jgi:hypothetical protein